MRLCFCSNLSQVGPSGNQEEPRHFCDSPLSDTSLREPPVPQALPLPTPAFEDGHRVRAFGSNVSWGLHKATRR